MSHMTLLMGPKRRRRWSDDIREQILAEAFSPGATVADVARRFQVSTSLIYKWRRASLMPPMGFAPAMLVDEAGRSGAEGSGFAIVVELPGEARVSLAANAPAPLVVATLKGLR